MGWLVKPHFLCECCDQPKDWNERSDGYVFVDICDDCETDFDTAEKALTPNGGTYS